VYSAPHQTRRRSKDILINSIIMSRRNRKERKAAETAIAEQKRERKRLVAKKNLVTLAEFLAVTATVFVVYRVLMNYRFFDIVLIVYMVLAAVCTFGYVIYNRGMSRKGVTPEMLPDDWSDEQKREFIEDGEMRLKKSKHLLILVFAFFFTFFVDIIELVAIPMFQSWFK